MKNFLVLLIFLINLCANSQVGGEKIYGFLNFSSSARQVALGGAANTIGGDVNMPMWNPAMISAEIEDKIAFNYSSYLSGVSLSSLNFVTKVNDKIGRIYGGVQYLNYGSAPRADINGNIQGEFKVYDLALTAGYAITSKSSNFTMGGNVKIINSSIDTYGSFGFAFDFAAVYRHSNKRTLYSLVVRNIGTQLKTYDGLKQDIPMKIDFGVSSRLEHLPLKWYFNLQDLQQWIIATPNPTNSEIDIDGDLNDEEISILDNAVRHIVVGAELFPDKKITVRAGYNFRRAKELALNDSGYNGGFSYGVGLNLKRIQFNFARKRFNPSSNASTFSLVINLF